MAETSWPWDVPAAGSTIQAAQYRTLSLAQGLRVPGILRGELNECSVTSSAGFANVASGRVGCYGTIYQNSASRALPVPVNSTGANRYDAIVVRYNWNAKTALLTYLTGSGVVTGPALTKSLSGTYDVLIGLTQVAPGSVTPVVDNGWRVFALGFGGSEKFDFQAATGANDDTGLAAGTWPNILSTVMQVPEWAVTARCRAKIGQAYPAGSGDGSDLITLNLGSILIAETQLNWANPSKQEDLLIEGSKDCSSLQKTNAILRTIGTHQGAGVTRVDTNSHHFITVEFLPD